MSPSNPIQEFTEDEATNRTSKDLQTMAEIFGSIFVLSNALQTMVDRELAPYDLTAKQWFMLACLERYFYSESSEGSYGIEGREGRAVPNLKNLAAVMGTSYQNVKQIALKLERTGFIRLSKDSKDKRSILICPTEKNRQFWLSHSSTSEALLLELFAGQSPEALGVLRQGLSRLLVDLGYQT